MALASRWISATSPSQRAARRTPTAFGPRPTTDGSEFYVAGVPIVNYLTAPFYLFDSCDTMDKIHQSEDHQDHLDCQQRMSSQFKEIVLNADLRQPEHFAPDARKPLLVLMHGDCEVSAKQLARILGVKHVAPCDPATAQRHTGYTVGGISPFGTRTPLPVYIEATILSLPVMYVNGGKRGFLVAIDPKVVRDHLQAVPVDVAIPENRSL